MSFPMKCTISVSESAPPLLDSTPALARPVLRRGQVAGRRVEPHVEVLLLLAWRTVRDLESEVRLVARDVPVLEGLGQPAGEEPADLRLDVPGRGGPLAQEVLVLGELDEIVRAAAQDGPDVPAPRILADRAVRVLQPHGLVGRAADLARVAILVLGAADRAGPAHVPVGQEAPVHFAVELLDFAPLDRSPLDELPVDPLRLDAVLLGVRLVELVVRDLESRVVLP